MKTAADNGGALVLIEGHRVRTHRCDDNFPGVVIADVLAPFGKRADASKSLWEGWARTRISPLSSRPIQDVSRDSSDNLHQQAPLLMHAEDVPLLIARLDRRGMGGEIKALHTRFLIVCRDILAAAFFNRAAIAAPLDVAAIVTIATQSAIAAVMPIFDRMLAAERQAREESRLVIGNRRARLILDEIGAIASRHAQRGSKAWRRTHRRVSNDVRDAIKHGVSGSWASLPESYIPQIDASLVRLRKEEVARESAQTDFGDRLPMLECRVPVGRPFLDSLDELQGAVRQEGVRVVRIPADDEEVKVPS